MVFCVVVCGGLWYLVPPTSTFANSEDPDEMQLNAAFHQGLHCKGKKDLLTKNTILKR